MLPPSPRELEPFRSRLTLLLLVSLPASALSSASGADLYVSPSGSDASSGTFYAPFGSVQHALNLAQPGDTVHLRGGTYPETIQFGSGAGNSGSAGHAIVLRAYEGAQGPETAIISSFDEVVPGQGGVGLWTPHDANIWKITLPSGWVSSPGSNLVRVDGEVKQEARWPNVPDAFNFDFRQMAFSEAGSVDAGSAGAQPPYSGNDFFDGTYTDDQFPVVPDGTWTGALIDLNPAGGNSVGTGVVTNNSGTTIQFRYRLNALQSVGAEEPYYLWNHLAALDHEDEAFLDVDGSSGTPLTLYLWSPEGDPGVQHTVEVRRRPTAIVVALASHLVIENITCLGGWIECRPSSSNVALRGMTVVHAGTGLNQLVPRIGAVALLGADCSIHDSYIGHTFGGGLIAGGLDTVAENNVVRRTQEFGVATWGGTNVTVLRNTIAENGGNNIAMHSPASVFEKNHCYLAGLRSTDRASINTNGSDVDMQNTVVRYNWVHDNVSRTNLSGSIQGGKGIRVDGGVGGVANILIHHNLIWRITGNKGMVLWPLPPTSVNYGNSGIRAYNNTTDGEIRFQGLGPNDSIAGHDIRNNIAKSVSLSGIGQESAIVSSNLLTNQGFGQTAWPGNLFASASFVNGVLGNFYLESLSPALEAGAVIPGITDGFAGTAPEIGALEYTGPGAPHWSAGAIILPRDLGGLTLSIEVTESGERQVLVNNLPEGRLLPDGFAVQLGAVQSEAVSYRHSITTHHATAVVRFLAAPPPQGMNPVAISIDSGTTWIPKGSLHVPPPGVSITPGARVTSLPAGGFTATIQTTGLLSKEKLIPIDIIRSAPGDLTANPVPLVIDTRALIASGEINPDGSNIRFRNAGRTQELDYWIESGLNSPSTLFWLRTQAGASPSADQLYLAVDDPSLSPVSDKTVLTTRYAVLEDPSLCVWYSANALANSCTEGDAIALLPDLGSRGFDASQLSPGAQPHWKQSRINGLPTFSFDGNDFLSAGNIGLHPLEKTSFVIVHRNDVATDDTSRLISSGSPIENMYSPAGGTEDLFVQGATRRLTTDLANFTIGRKSSASVKFYTGEIAEILVFDEELETSSPARWTYLKEYSSRKYSLLDEARAIARPNDTVEPARLHIGDTEITAFTILPDGSIEFTVPPLDPGASLPASFPIAITAGNDTFTLPAGLVYFEPNYDFWAAPLVGGGLDSPFLDIEGDRLENLLEYALDLDPQTADSAPFTVTPGVGASGQDVLHLTFRLSTSATDALLLIGKSTDLQDWTTYRSDGPSVSVLDPDPDGDGSAVLYRAEFPVEPSGDAFFRLRAELLLP